MSIVTRRGDKGLTSLYPSGIVFKDDPRIDLIGTLDEVSSFLGAAASLMEKKAASGFIRKIQKDLFCVCAEAATPAALLGRLDKRVSRVHIAHLERMIERLESGGCRPRSFVLPGGTLACGLLDIARSLARRAERRAVTLLRRGKIKNRLVVVFLNRLSDLLYLLARSCHGKTQA